MIASKAILTDAAKLLRNHVGFHGIRKTEIIQLIKTATLINLKARESLLLANSTNHYFYLLLQGEIEAFNVVGSSSVVPMASFRRGEIIGLHPSLIFTNSIKDDNSKLIAKSDCICLEINLPHFKKLLEKFKKNKTTEEFAFDLIKINFLKKIAPFTHFTIKQLKWLSQKMVLSYHEKDAIIFHEGDQGEYCYFVVSGLISIAIEEEIAQIKPFNYFGETSLLSNLPRNATAKALTGSVLLSLGKNDFLQLINQDKRISKLLHKTYIYRGRPNRFEKIETTEQINPDGDKCYILNNTSNKYFRLSEEGWFVWQQINGKNTLRDINLLVYQQFRLFDPDFIFQLFISLYLNKFIYFSSEKQILLDVQLPLWKHLLIKFADLMQAQYVFTHSDRALSYCYNKAVKYLYLPLFIKLYMLLAVTGFITFIIHTSSIVHALSPTDYLYFFYSLPLIYSSLIFHELAHAFTTKYYGRKVHAFGIGWFWVSAVAFVDTSDMWKGSRKQRIIVNSAGIFTELFLASILTFISLVIDSHSLQVILWFAGFSIYLSAFLNLCPIFEYDGYYLLMDLLNKPNLRVASIQFLGDALRQRRVNFLQHRPEIIYWLYSLGYILSITGIFYFITHSFLRPLFLPYVFSMYLWFIPLIFFIISVLVVLIKVWKINELRQD